MASFSPLGEGGERQGGKRGIKWGPVTTPHSMPIPDSGGFLSPTWTMVELKLH